MDCLPVTPARRSSTSSRTPFGSSRRKSKTPCGAADRFIPSRSSRNTDRQLHAMSSCINRSALQDTTAALQQHTSSHSKLDDDDDVDTQRFKDQLADSLFGSDESHENIPVNASKVLSFRNKAPRPPTHHENNMRVLYTQNRAPICNNARRRTRHIPTSAERVLDAPDLLDDYYVNLLDWSRQNVLAVGLGQTLYLWDAATGQIEMLMETRDEGNSITSVQWMEAGTHLAIGTSQHDVQLWDVAAKKRVRCMNGHTGRVSSLAWSSHVLASGSRDTNIHCHDVRIANHQFQTFESHEQEVCGLKWSPDGSQLASGGNDNVVAIWELPSARAKHLLRQHSAGVKALAWSPHSHNLLASGGGTADRHIRFWNTQNGVCLSNIDTHSQVCGLVWNPHEKEILSAHGFSQNQLSLWKYPSLNHSIDLTGHTSRVLHMALSPDGTTVCSAASDETLRFWKVFEPTSKTTRVNSRTAAKRSRKLNGMKIR